MNAASRPWPRSGLAHMYPAADIPVVQLSLDARKPLDWHLQLGTKLAGLRERGVLIVGSGNVVHNLRAIDWRQPDAGFDWARRFDEDARVLMRERPQDIASLAGHRDYRMAVPTDEHFLPLHVAWGAAGEHARVERVVTGFEAGALALHSWLFHPAR